MNQEKCLKVEELRNKGMTVAKALKKAGIHAPKYYAWRKKQAAPQADGVTVKFDNSNWMLEEPKIRDLGIKIRAILSLEITDRTKLAVISELV